ncbi:MAG: OsmC family protein [Woeseiaceae bacterium]
MQQFPHQYSVSASAHTDGDVSLTAAGLDKLESAPPAEFGGPGDKWSPESLLVAAVADCFILSFKAIAKASRFDWLTLECSANGILDRVDGGMRFTGFEIQAQLELASGNQRDKADRLLQKAEKTCLITNSLIADSHLTVSVSARE